MSFAIIESEIRKLNTSEPVFEIKVSKSWQDKEEICLGDHIGATATNRIESGDGVFTQLVKKNFSERFSSSDKSFVIETDSIKSKCLTEIKQYLLNFITNEMSKKKKNFLDTKMGKWYSRYACKAYRNNSNNYLDDKLISLYGYLRTHLDTADAEKHICNGVAVMQVLFDKNFREDHIMLRRKRRRQ